MSAEPLWNRMKSDGLVEGDYPARGQAASPWYVRVMLGIAGWIGALFLLLFVGAAFAFIMEDGIAALMLGATCCGAAFLLFWRFDGNDFVEQFALAISLAGQVMIVVGLADFLKVDDPPLYFAAAAAEIGLAVIIPNFLHRVLATSGAAIALALGVNQLSLHGFAAPLLCAGLAFVWLEPKRWAAGGKLWRPIGYGILLALMLVETFRLFGGPRLFGLTGEAPSWMELYGPLIGRGITAAILVWAAVTISREEGLAPSSRPGLAALGAAIALGLLSVEMPGLASALLTLLLGFAAGNRILMALGILGLFGFVAHYYYSLHATLLEKSGLLAITGICLLAAYVLLRRLFPAPAVAPLAAEAADA